MSTADIIGVAVGLVLLIANVWQWLAYRVAPEDRPTLPDIRQAERVAQRPMGHALGIEALHLELERLEAENAQQAARIRELETVIADRETWRHTA